MDKLVREQLNKCRVAKIPAVSDDFSGDLYIGKRDENDLCLEINSSYLIEIKSDYLNSIDYVTNTEKWNGNKHLEHSHLKIAVTQFLSDMMKVDAIGYDNCLEKDSDKVYLGYWLPFKQIDILSKL